MHLRRSVIEFQEYLAGVPVYKGLNHCELGMHPSLCLRILCEIFKSESVLLKQAHGPGQHRNGEHSAAYAAEAELRSGLAVVLILTVSLAPHPFY